MNDGDSTATGSSEISREVDAVIIGAGPIGLTLANLLGEYGIEVLLIEKNASTVSEPRAVTIDDETLRTMQSIGLDEEVLSKSMPDYGVNYYSPEGKEFARIMPSGQDYGFPKRNAFHQPVLEAQLRIGIERYQNLDAWFEHEVIVASQDESGASLDVKRPNGAIIRVTCKYLLGCDGAGSATREKALGVQLEGSTYADHWIIIDLLNTRNPYRQTEIYCDPARPGISLPGPGKTRRYEFQLLKGETDEEVLDPQNLSKLLASVGPDADCDRVRTTVYGFHARIAPKWKSGRISIHGDAAHLSPPFAGQGMNSGIRDSFNYGWKVAWVIKGIIGPGLLESYESERKPHATALIQMAVRQGKVMMRETRLAAFMIRLSYHVISMVPGLRTYISQMKYKPKPRYRDGFFVKDDLPENLTPVGRMFPQPRVELPTGGWKLLDNLSGNGFCLVSVGREPSKLLGQMPDNLAGIELNKFCILPKDFNYPDLDGVAYGRDMDGLLSPYMESYDNHVFLLRPDRYVAAHFSPENSEQTIREFEMLVQSTFE